jgi:hypothetical protein
MADMRLGEVRRGGALGEVIEDDVTLLDTIFNIIGANGARWFPVGDEADRLVALINEHETAWVDAYRGLANAARAEAADRKKLAQITARAEKAEEGINFLNDYVADLGDDSRKPNYAEARDYLLDFFATLLPIRAKAASPKRPSPKRSSPKTASPKRPSPKRASPKPKSKLAAKAKTPTAKPKAKVAVKAKAKAAAKPKAKVAAKPKAKAAAKPKTKAAVKPKVRVAHAPRAAAVKKRTARDVGRGCSQRTEKKSGSSCIRTIKGSWNVGRCAPAPTGRLTCRTL